jgi:hypothetical protein
MTDEEFEEFAAVAAAYGTKHTTQEPVAWISSYELNKVATAKPTGEDDEDVAPGQQLTSVTLSTKKHSYYGEIPLYTVSKREWVGLTDEDRAELDEKYYWYDVPHDVMYDVEAKLKEKNA